MMPDMISDFEKDFKNLSGVQTKTGKDKD